MKLVPLLALAALLLPGAAFDARAQMTATIGVSAKVVSGCSITDVGGAPGSQVGTLDFGSDSAVSQAVRTSALQGDTQLVLNCPSGFQFSMRIDGGTGLSNGNRQLSLIGGGDTDRLPYELFEDSGMTRAIATNTSVSVLVPPGVDTRLPIHGRLVLPGDRRPGEYVDTLLVTLEW